MIPLDIGQTASKGKKYAPQDDSWSIQKGTKIDSDPLSHPSARIMQQWINTCRSHHQHCRRDHSSKHSQCLPRGKEMNTADEDVPLPHRLIDVNSSNESLIRACQGSEQAGKYLALSHRWVNGLTPEWVTTQNTLDQGIAGLLSAIFQPLSWMPFA